jgi:hypothetical protein
MKNPFRIICVVFALAASGLHAQNVDRDELEKNQATVNFINYEGPHSRIDTVEQIRAIGLELGRAIKNGASRAGAENRYFVIHCVADPDGEKFDADVFGLGVDVGVDHIRNLRLIIQGYLQGAYDYSAADAALLARYVTIYNAVFRGDWDFFTGRYKNVVVENLVREKAGLSIRYDEWPGQTLMTIPLGTGRPGSLSAIDTSGLTDPGVIDSMRQDDDRGIEDRKDMVDLKEREADEANQSATLQREAIAEEEKNIERDRETSAQTQRRIEQEQRQTQQRREEAQQQQQSAQRQREEAQRQQQEAQRRQQEAQRQQQEAQRQREEAQRQREEAQRRQEQAQKDAEAGKISQTEAERRQEAAQQQQQTAQQQQETAQQQQEEAQRQQEEAQRQQEAAQQQQQTAQQQQEAAQQQQEEARRRQEELTQEEAAAQQQQETIAQREAQQAQRQQEADAAQGRADQKTAEAQEERRQIAQDQQEIIASGGVAAAAPGTARGALLAAGILTTNAQTNTALGRLLRVDPSSGAAVQTSKMNTVNTRTVTLSGNRIFAIAGINVGNGAIRLVEIGGDTLEMLKQGEDDIHPNSLLWANGSNLYAITVVNGKNYLARFDSALTRQAVSTVEVHPYASCIFQGDRVLTQKTDGTPLLLNGQTLK